jgi:hypothetical protein
MSEREENRLIGDIAAALRQARPLSPGFRAGVMARVRAARRERWWERAAGWLVEPRPVLVSPLGGLAMAAAVAGWLVIPAGLGGPGVPAGSVGAAPEAAELVPFALRAPGARSVSVVGDFNGWDAAAMPLEFQPGTGAWTGAVRLAPGRYGYSFVVDGRVFVADPAAPRSVGDDFGAPTSVVVVGRSGVRASGGST